MHIPIENEHLATCFRVFLLADSDGNGNVVEEAEAHGLIMLCVVPGWTDDRKSVLHMALDHVFASLDGSARRKERHGVRHGPYVQRLPALVKLPREIPQLNRTQSIQTLHPCQVLGGVSKKDLFRRGIPGRDPPHELCRTVLQDGGKLRVGTGVHQARPLEGLEDFVNTPWILRVVRAWREVGIHVHLHAHIVATTRRQETPSMKLLCCRLFRVSIRLIALALRGLLGFTDSIAGTIILCIFHRMVWV